LAGRERALVTFQVNPILELTLASS
jgi:hypothetical protein